MKNPEQVPVFAGFKIYLVLGHTPATGKETQGVSWAYIAGPGVSRNGIFHLQWLVYDAHTACNTVISGNPGGLRCGKKSTHGLRKGNESSKAPMRQKYVQKQPPNAFTYGLRSSREPWRTRMWKTKMEYGLRKSNVRIQPPNALTYGLRSSREPWRTRMQQK